MCSSSSKVGPFVCKYRPLHQGPSYSWVLARKAACWCQLFLLYFFYIHSTSDDDDDDDDPTLPISKRNVPTHQTGIKMPLVFSLFLVPGHDACEARHRALQCYQGCCKMCFGVLVSDHTILCILNFSQICRTNLKQQSCSYGAALGILGHSSTARKCQARIVAGPC